jgi:hypothetical protein
MLPCFFGGLVMFFVAVTSSASQIMRRVSLSHHDNAVQ